MEGREVRKMTTLDDIARAREKIDRDDAARQFVRYRATIVTYLRVKALFGAQPRDERAAEWRLEELSEARR